MARRELYSQKDHSVIWGGIPLEDFHDGDDVIAFEFEGNQNTITRGLDANKPSIGSQLPSTLTVRLKPTSISIDLLNGLFRVQNSDTPTTFDIVIRTGVQDVLVLTECVFEPRGFQTGGPAMQARTFIANCSNYEMF